MSISFFCPHCHARQEVSHLHPGEQALCRKCGGLAVVPERDGAVATPVQPAPKTVQSKTTPEPSSPPPILIQRIQAEIERLDEPKSNMGRSLAVLLISVIAFVGFVAIGNTVEFVAILVLVLLIHETGHLLGMKLFGYKNVQMLFIPFLGAAVSGRPSDPRAGRRAVVTLLGPVPGIGLGIVAMMVWAVLPFPRLYLFAEMLIFINVFNLLPLYPLDGGRVLQHALFTRYPRLRLVFQVITVLLLGLLAVLLQSIAMGVFAFFLLVSLAAMRIDLKALRQLKERYGEAPPDLAARIPIEHVEFLVPRLLGQAGMEEDRPKNIAAVVHRVWDTYREKPPGAWAALGIILVYVISLLVGLVAFAVISTR